MLKDLIKVSNRLDTLGLTKEADYLDSVIKKLSGSNPSQAELLGFDADRNVSENYSKSELKLLDTLDKFIDAFGQVLNESFYSGELDALYRQAEALQYQITEKVNQASFERGMESSSPEVERMDEEVGLNPPWHQNYDDEDYEDEGDEEEDDEEEDDEEDSDKLDAGVGPRKLR